jgi:hypothetical protein
MPLTKLSRNLAIAIFASTSVLAQQQPASNPPVPDAASSDELSEIHIDHDCRVLTSSHPTAAHPNSQPRYHYNNVVCHIESNLRSSHWEQTSRNGVPKRVYVHVREREYLLQNTTDKPVAFIVNQPLPKGWQIDSDPQPIDIVGPNATFRVMAQPGQTVRLHIGERS